jgi:hypothetical protein
MRVDAAVLTTKDTDIVKAEARQIAANIAKLPDLLH